MAHRAVSQRIHDVRMRESWDKVVLGLAFAVGVCGGIALKVMEFHPFVTAGFSALVLILYACLAYASTSLRLEPEVIGDNSYYLGFLFTLTSLSVTLYFVIESGTEDRAKLIPEVISGFGVALVSTIVGVFIRVLMMQFRLDIVSRERETRVEFDEVARKLRVEMAQSLRQMKLFSVESLQHSAEREAEFKRATDSLVSATQKALADTARFLHQETSQVFREQSAAAIEAIRVTIADASKAALGQVRTSFEEIGKTSEDLRATHAVARGAVEQANATLHLETNAMVDLVAQLSRRIRTISDEVETSGNALSCSFGAAATKLEQTLTDISTRLDVGLQAFDQATRDAATRSHLTLNDLTEKLRVSAEQLAETAAAGTKVIGSNTEPPPIPSIARDHAAR